MDLRYLGFDQKRNTRAYRFDRLAKGESPARFVVTADLALFLKHQIGFQEGPALCAHKLAADLHPGDHQLTDADLLAYANARAAARSLRTKSRKPGPRS
jgi:hypothetical protein